MIRVKICGLKAFLIDKIVTEKQSNIANFEIVKLHVLSFYSVSYLNFYS